MARRRGAGEGSIYLRVREINDGLLSPRFAPSQKSWASDFPHPDHRPAYVPEVTRLARALPEPAQAGFLGANVLAAFGIDFGRGAAGGAAKPRARATHPPRRPVQPMR